MINLAYGYGIAVGYNANIAAASLACEWCAVLKSVFQLTTGLFAPENIYSLASAEKFPAAVAYDGNRKPTFIIKNVLFGIKYKKIGYGHLLAISCVYMRAAILAGFI